MTVVGLRPSAPLTNGGDLGQVMKKTGAAPENAGLTTVKLGSELVTFGQPRTFLVRYEVPVPLGAKILGLKFDATTASGSLGTTQDISAGFLKRQENANAWESSSGVRAWTTENQIPLPEFQNVFGTIITDDAVFWNGAPAIEDISTPIFTGTFQEWSIGEGTLSTGTAANVTGLIAQLQSYIDDSTNEATRGSTEAGSIPVMLAIFRHYVGTVDIYQVLRTVDQLNQANHPFLNIEYGFEPVVTITNPASPPTVTEGDNVNFVATSIDVEDGDISSGIVWTSDLDGALGVGASINVTTLSVGTHIITATSTDSDSQVGTDTITVIVEVAPGVPIKTDVIAADPSIVVKQDLDSAMVKNADTNIVVNRVITPADVLVGSNSIVIKRSSATVTIEIDEG